MILAAVLLALVKATAPAVCRCACCMGTSCKVEQVGYAFAETCAMCMLSCTLDFPDYCPEDPTFGKTGFKLCSDDGNFTLVEDGGTCELDEHCRSFDAGISLLTP